MRRGGSSPSLTDAVRAILSLGIHRRVPVRIVKDYGVCTDEIDPKPPRAGAQNEGEYLGITIEFFHQNLPLVDPSRAIETCMRVGVRARKGERGKREVAMPGQSNVAGCVRKYTCP